MFKTGYLSIKTNEATRMSRNALKKMYNLARGRMKHTLSLFHSARSLQRAKMSEENLKVIAEFY